MADFIDPQTFTVSCLSLTRFPPDLQFPAAAQDRFAPGEGNASILFKLQQQKLKAAAGPSAPASPQPASTNINSVTAPVFTSSYNAAPSGQSQSGPVTSYNPVRGISSPAASPSPVFRPGSSSSFNPGTRFVSASSNVDASVVSSPPLSPDSSPPATDDDGDSDGPPGPITDNEPDQEQYQPPSPSDLLKFPPNNNYEATQAGSKPPSSSSSTSYLPPASGNEVFVGPINPDYLLPKQQPKPAAPQNDVEAVQLAINANSIPDRPAPPSPPSPPPPPPPSGPAPYVIGAGDDHHHHGYLPSATPPPPPPSHPSFTGQYGVDASPELIYDFDADQHQHHHQSSYPDHFDYHDFIHHHEHHDEPPPPPPPPTTTETVLVAVPEPRVKTYSYYYLGRKLWYVPLFFTLWFTFYVAALIIKSIARHKVQVPNHWQSRRRRALVEEPHLETLRKVNKLTYFVMNNLAGSEKKYN